MVCNADLGLGACVIHAHSGLNSATESGIDVRSYFGPAPAQDACVEGSVQPVSTPATKITDAAREAQDVLTFEDEGNSVQSGSGGWLLVHGGGAEHHNAATVSELGSSETNLELPTKAPNESSSNTSEALCSTLFKDSIETSTEAYAGAPATRAASPSDVGADEGDMTDARAEADIRAHTDSHTKDVSGGQKNGSKNPTSGYTASCGAVPGGITFDSLPDCGMHFVLLPH